MATRPEEEKKKNPLSGLIRYLRDTRGELKKVVWPTKKQIINNTVVVIGVIFVASILICSFDAALSTVVQKLFGA